MMVQDILFGRMEIGGPENNYTLHIGQAQGPHNGHDAIANHNGQPFRHMTADGGLIDAKIISDWWTCQHKAELG